MKKLVVTSSIIFFVLIFLAFKPISLSKNPKTCKGKIISVSESGIKDVVFGMKDNVNTFYINRGFEYFEEKDLNSLIGKNVVVYYSEGWTPLDPLSRRSKSIEKLEVENTIFFKL